jgi:hypothetical protein
MDLGNIVHFIKDSCPQPTFLDRLELVSTKFVTDTLAPTPASAISDYERLELPFVYFLRKGI